MMKPLPALLASVVCFANTSMAASAIDQDTKAWAEGISTQLNTTFGVADPNVVPSFSTEPTGNEGYMNNPDQLASDAVTEAATDEAAQLIHGIPQKPDVANQSWYQNAHDITKNPKDELGGLTGDYTDCVEVTTPGGSYSEIQTCTETATATTATCTSDLKIEVDSHHLYGCKKELNTTGETCSVGRVIDVTQSHRYSCKDGRLSRTKSCEDKLDITIERARFKYLPETMCRFTQEQYDTNKITSSYLEIPKSGRFDYATYNEGSATISTYKDGFSCSVLRIGTYYGNTSDPTIIFTGTEFHGCRSSDSIWEDGYCHSEEPIEYMNALPECTEGDLEDGLCVAQPVWIEDYIATGNYYNNRLASYGQGKTYMVWALLDGSGAHYIYEAKSKDYHVPGFEATVSLVGKAPGYPATAKMKMGQYATTMGPGIKIYRVSIFLSTGETNAPTYQCEENLDPIPGTNMCASGVGYSEYRVVDTWSNTCG
ncbi:hypothetical protein V9N52_003816 [Vibrio navarrensis]